MKKIACLGPEGTYSDIACKEYNNGKYEIEYYPSILKVIDSVDDDTIAIVPFENTLDGFVMESLDKIIKNNLNIKQQIKLDIDFAFVGNSKNLHDIKEVYSQFKTYGQCLNFIEKNDFNVIKTESNIDSLHRLLKSGKEFGAIIPMHSLEEFHFPLEILHIADSSNNQTRFFVVDNNKKCNNIDDNVSASLVFTSIIDEPGILSKILDRFYKNNINLKAILSRPDKTQMGKYNFYIEVNLSKKEKDYFYKLLNEYEYEDSTKFNVNVLGIYKEL